MCSIAVAECISVRTESAAWKPADQTARMRSRREIDWQQTRNLNEPNTTVSSAF
jgi:hypothetical protein